MVNIEKNTVKQKKNYNFNEKTRYIGFRCPKELFNSTLKGKNLTKTIVGLLEGNIKQSVKQLDGSIKQSVKQPEIQILKECIIEFNKLMSEIRPIIPPHIDKNKIKEGIKTCREI